MDPVLVHFIADWCLQSQWMASSKTSRWLPAAVHVAVYGAVFLVLVPASRGWVIAPIVGTHYLIDRYRLARHVNWAANFIAPRVWIPYPTPPGRPPNPGASPIYHGRWQRNPPWSECSQFGSPPGVPDYIGFIVMVTVDQIMHLLCNWAALRWLG